MGRSSDEATNAFLIFVVFSLLLARLPLAFDFASFLFLIADLLAVLAAVLLDESPSSMSDDSVEVSFTLFLEFFSVVFLEFFLDIFSVDLSDLFLAVFWEDFSETFFSDAFFFELLERDLALAEEEVFASESSEDCACEEKLIPENTSNTESNAARNLAVREAGTGVETTLIVSL
jgi:hypothetical protein